MDETLERTLKSSGWTFLFPYQELVVTRILENKDLRQAVILPTGAGKSLCFQLPARLLDGPTLVIFPLRSLTADQKRRCEEAGISCEVLQGGQTKAQRRKISASLAARKIQILLTNPETLEQKAVQDLLAGTLFAHVVIDEAHCVRLWGQSFRPSYKRLGETLRRLKFQRMTAFTATASDRVLEDLKADLFGGGAYDLIRANPDRPNLYFSREPYLSLRLSLLRAVIREKRPTVVFCRSREMVRQWALHLHHETAFDVKFYHAGLSAEEKKAVEEWFFQSQDGVLISTNAYGMGVDKSGIRTVIHVEEPPTVEDYLQESGRAGRDGKPAKAILLQSASAERGSEKGCLRRSLFSVLGADLDDCAGCDKCHGKAAQLPPELGAVCKILSGHRHRLTAEECRAMLAGRLTPKLWESRLEKLSGWGVWKDHDDLTCGELWRGLENGGWVKFSSCGWFKGLLTRVGIS